MEGSKRAADDQHTMTVRESMLYQLQKPKLDVRMRLHECMCVLVGNADLHRMYSNVNVSTKQSVINLLCEQPFATNVGQGLVQDLVTSRFDDDNV